MSDPKITSDPDILGGTPCILGTRIPARAIKEFAEAGYDIPAIIREYPTLTEEQVRAALEWEGDGEGERDDLVERLRKCAVWAPWGAARSMREAADRIEELEAALCDAEDALRGTADFLRVICGTPEEQPSVKRLEIDEAPER